MLKRAGIVDLHFQDLRANFSTRLMNLDVSCEIRAILLGHRLKGATFEYSHGGKDQLREAVERLVSRDGGRNQLKALVPRDRIELSTPAFSGLCSAN